MVLPLWSYELLYHRRILSDSLAIGSFCAFAFNGDKHMSPTIKIKNSRFICETNHYTNTHVAKTTNTYIEGWGGSADPGQVCEGLLDSCCDPNTEVVHRIRSNPYGHWCARMDSNRTTFSRTGLVIRPNSLSYLVRVVVTCEHPLPIILSRNK